MTQGPDLAKRRHIASAIDATLKDDESQEEADLRALLQQWITGTVHGHGSAIPQPKHGLIERLHG